MTQDFAKIKPEPLLEQRVVQAPPAWSLMLTGAVVGASLAVFACVLFYLSGNVPPLNQPTLAGNNTANEERKISGAATPEEENPEVTYEFYQELEEYEVKVDSVPVALTPEQAPDAVLENPFILQSGAFELRSSAENELQRQQLIGLEVVVKQQELVGRTLFLIQSGPYETSGLLTEAEQLLRRNGIPHIRLKQQ